jgi:hypothetical protein
VMLSSKSNSSGSRVKQEVGLKAAPPAQHRPRALTPVFNLAAINHAKCSARVSKQPSTASAATSTAIHMALLQILLV